MALTLPRVLVVEDNEGCRDSVVRMLSTNGFRPVAVESAEAALDVLAGESPDAVLIDLRLPGMDGHALLRVIRRDDPGMPAILMSGDPTMEDGIRAVRLNAVDFLCKPITADMLVGALERALAARTAPRRQPRAPRLAARPQVAPSPEGRGPDAHARSPIEPARPGAAAPRAAAPRPSGARGPGHRSIAEVIREAGRRLERGTHDLPVLDPRIPTIYSLIEKPSCGVDEVLAVVGRDPTLAAVVLRASNSSFYNASVRAISDLREACVQLGNRRVMALTIEALARSTFALRDEPFRTILPAFWRNAFVTARAADCLARRVHRCSPRARRLLPALECLYVAALMHNVGELFLLQIVSDAGLSLDDDGVAELAAEVDRWHEIFGRTLARAWALPPLVARLAGHHHRPAAAVEPEHERLARSLLLAAWSLTLEAGATYLPGQAEAADAQPFLPALEIPPDDLTEIRADMSGWFDAEEEVSRPGRAAAGPRTG